MVIYNFFKKIMFLIFKPEVIEIHVGLSENSGRIQMALLDILNVLLQEFKGCCSYVIF